jgi:hypothetical protein
MRKSIFDMFNLQIATSVGTVGVHNSTFNKTKNTNTQKKINKHPTKHAILATSTDQRTSAQYQ